MKRLADAPELLDGDLDDPRTLRDNLRDLRRANRLTGGVALTRRALDALAPEGTAVTLLDVGTGGADIPIALLAAARRRGRRLAVTATDSRPEVLEAALAARPAVDRLAGLTLEVADGRALPYPDRAFDVAHASLVVHHLEPPDAIALLGELRRVSRRGVIVNDLSRRPITLLGAWLLSRLFTRNRYSRYDAPLSARRAYTLVEMRALLLHAGLRPVYETSGIVGHRYAIAAVST
ncbi:MAG TPA: methyltransferase domain-containing protein [Candidatus Limnocylindrales bacterium]|jgi:ubiquinone/menaquinone biosynthesis C-methylase UbiE